MSRITLSGNASGTGNFTLASPNSNTDRTLTLPDATGTVNVSGLANEVPAGSAGAPAIYPTGDTNTGIFFPAADTIAFSEGGAESMRIDASGNVGIGVASTDAKLDVSANAQTTARFTGSGATFVGIANQTAFSSGSVYSGVYYDVRNELGNTVANFLADVNADGSSAWVLSTQPAGTRTDRRVDRLRISSGGDLQFNSGYGSVATAYGCRAWVNFNGTGTVAINASGNVSSITDNGAGDYTVNFTTALPDANYCTQCTAYPKQIGQNINYAIGLHTTNFAAAPTTKTTSAVRIFISASNVTAGSDMADVNVAIFR
jgi:hypothetical protein